MRPLILIALLGVLPLLQCGDVDSSGSGSFDPTFGANGKVTTDFSEQNDSIAALVEQADGKIIAAGYYTGSGLKHLALARYETNGELDTSFGERGKASRDFGIDSEAVAVKVDSNQKILVLGRRYTSSKSEIVLLRYGTTGALDGTFAAGGIAVLIVSGAQLTAGTMLIQSDGRILVGGGKHVSSSDSFFLARYNTNGALDTNFGTSGMTATVMSAGEQNVQSLILDEDGKLLAGGYARVGPLGDFGVARYSANGILDTAFGVSGIRLIDFSNGLSTSDDSLFYLTLDDDENILAMGSAFDAYTRRFAFARLSKSGNLDPKFGTGGKLTSSLERGGTTYTVDARAAAEDSRGQFFLVGGATLGSDADFTLSRFSEDLESVAAFGIEGTLARDFSSGADQARAVALLGGKIVVAGQAGTARSGTDFALLRLR